jgi:hypothetical protein
MVCRKLLGDAAAGGHAEQIDRCVKLRLQRGGVLCGECLHGEVFGQAEAAIHDN